MYGTKTENGKPADLTHFAWVSILAALATIALKTGAYLIVNSVSLLSDAMESTVNLVAAVIALITLKLAAKPADERYTFGRSKAEYFSAATEGAMIFGAAALIIFSAACRLIYPSELSHIGWGLAVSLVPTLINAVTGVYLLRAGKKYDSPALQADGKHLFTDVVTTCGVLAGVAVIWATGVEILDPLIAILVALNIVHIGIGIIRSALAGLMDVTLPTEENAKIVEVLQSLRTKEIDFHGLRTRRSGRQRYICLDAQVPDDWTVRRGHDFAMKVEKLIAGKIKHAEVTIHIEPISDPASYEDIPEGFVPLDS